MKSNKKIIVGSILAIVIIAFYFFLLHPKLFPTTAPNKPTPTTNIKPTEPMPVFEGYLNLKYRYIIQFPNNWPYQEFPDSKSGASFANGVVVVDVSGKMTGPPYPPIQEYVKTAATQEIQSFEKLNSLKTVTTKDGLTGYETTWIVGPPPMLNPPKDYKTKTTISQPITYFAIPGDDAMVLTVRINTQHPTQEQIKMYNEMIKSVSFQK